VRLFPHARHAVEGHPVVRNFFRDRCPHLAAMVAYYALLSLVPLLFLALSLIGLVGHADESSALVRELQRVVPGSSADDLVSFVRSLQRNSAELGLIGLIGLLWGSLGFLSALESALNLVYDVPNRPFVRQKLLVFGLIGGGLAALLVSLVATTATQTFLDRHATSLVRPDDVHVALTLLVSALITFGFLLVVYGWLPNTQIALREALPGTVCATLLLQLTFQSLPLFLSVTSGLPALKAFGGATLLLVWFYLMGNVVLLGAEINWWIARGRAMARAGAPDALLAAEALGRS